MSRHWEQSLGDRCGKNDSGLPGVPLMRISKYSIASPCGPGAHRRDPLSRDDCIAFVHRDRLRVPVRTQIGFVVLEDHQLAVTEQSRAGIHDMARSSGANVLAELTAHR